MALAFIHSLLWTSLLTFAIVLIPLGLLFIVAPVRKRRRMQKEGTAVSLTPWIVWFAVCAAGAALCPLFFLLLAFGFGQVEPLMYAAMVAILFLAVMFFVGVWKQSKWWPVAVLGIAAAYCHGASFSEFTLWRGCAAADRLSMQSIAVSLGLYHRDSGVLLEDLRKLPGVDRYTLKSHLKNRLRIPGQDPNACDFQYIPKAALYKKQLVWLYEEYSPLFGMKAWVIFNDSQPAELAPEDLAREVQATRDYIAAHKPDKPMKVGGGGQG